MNANPKALRILCFGDSNTFGQVPGESRERYALDQRWTGILQSKLGTDYEVIEEGLSSRTVDLDDPDPLKPGRNGLSFLAPLLSTHVPLNWMVIMLGTNDLKVQYNRSALEVSNSMHDLIDHIDVYFSQKTMFKRPKILLVCPPIIKETRPLIYGGATKKSQELASLYEKVASDFLDCHFLDASKFVESSDVDGVHFEVEGHQRLGIAVAERIQSLT